MHLIRTLFLCPCCGERLSGEDLDGYAARVTTTGPMELGVFKPADGAITLRAEVVGSNPKSKKPGTLFGLDCVVVEPQ